MFAPETNDKQLNEKLNKLSYAYQLPSVLNKSLSILPSNYNHDNYQNTIFASSINLSDKSPSVSSTNFANQSNLIVGQGITNNAGIPLTSVNKLPSYQWSFKHEDHEHNPHHSNKGKHILHGLGATDSISLLGGTSVNSTALNSKLIRLPILTEKNKHKKNSLINGLPYYKKDIIDKQIRKLNMKKAKLNLAVANSSHFSQQFNETVDDVEYLHGEVILNQFLNNKRTMRNYQWMMYYHEKSGGKKLSDGVDRSLDNVKCKTVRNFQKSLEKKHKKEQEVQLRRQKKELERQRKSLEAEKKAQLEDQKPKEAKAEKKDDNSDEDSSSDESSSDEDSSDDSSSGENSSEDEDEDEDNDESSDEDDSSDGEDQKEFNRFQMLEIPVNLNKELIIEKQLPIDDRELLEYQNRLYGLQTSLQMQQEAKQTNGIINSKIVRIRRKPNPNSLGYSNIRKKRPPYAL